MSRRHSHSHSHSHHASGHSHTAPAVSPSEVIEVDGMTIDLRNRFVAALLAWLLPGAGHYYQGRRAKGILFGFTILTTFLVGFAIGNGHVVYASWVPGDKRWHYFCQIGAGVVAFPALVQGNRMRNHTEFSGDMPMGFTDAEYEPLWGGFMAPPRRPVLEDRADDVAAWYARLGAGYEMGTWYTMIAGLLNILVIYDAFAGPLSTPISGRKGASDEDESEGEGDTDLKGGSDAR